MNNNSDVHSSKFRKADFMRYVQNCEELRDFISASIDPAEVRGYDDKTIWELAKLGTEAALFLKDEAF